MGNFINQVKLRKRERERELNLSLIKKKIKQRTKTGRRELERVSLRYSCDELYLRFYCGTAYRHEGKIFALEGNALTARRVAKCKLHFRVRVGFSRAARM